MNIEVINYIPFSELENKIRNVPLKGMAADGSKILVYSKADIRLQKIDPEEVNPTTFYLLEKNLQFQRELYAQLRILKGGLDTLALEGAVEILNCDSGKIWTLTPPIIEITPRQVWYKAAEGEIDYMHNNIAHPCQKSYGINIPIINDGAHRIALAREQNKAVQVVWISKIDKRYPFYAHPNSWDDVKIVSEVPKDKRDKKMYRLNDCYAVYRDFEVIGCGAPRSA